MLTNDEAAALFTHGKPDAQSGRMKITDAQHAAGLYFALRNTLARRLAGGLKQFAPGLSVTVGDYVTSDGGVYIALETGTTGTIAPSGYGGNISDGVIRWAFFSMPELLTIATPIPSPL
jgi:hypothetical protein